jgi:hypothetical protein
MPHDSTKSSAKSSCSSLQSKTSSVSSAAKSRAKAIGRGTKRIKNDANTVVRPPKRAKHALSNVSSPVISEISDSEDDPTDYQPSIKTNTSLEVTEIVSDEEHDDHEKELGTSPFYSSLAISLISIHSGGQGGLEIPHILLLQA